jgi:hypothetical protein
MTPVSDRDAGGLIPAAQEALAKAMHAAGIALTAAGIGLAALVVGMIALVMATVAIVSRIVGEALSLFAELVTGMIDAVVAMVPDILHAAIMAGAMAAMWVSFNWTWAAYSRDMPAWLAAMLAGAFVVLPVAWAIYRQLWPAVVVVSLGIVGVGWLLWHAGPVVRVGAVVGGLGAVVMQDVMRKGGDAE